MKITRTSQAALSAQQRSQLANAGCKVCPCCGETKSEDVLVKASTAKSQGQGVML